jgi:hypothetical protein
MEAARGALRREVMMTYESMILAVFCIARRFDRPSDRYRRPGDGQHGIGWSLTQQNNMHNNHLHLSSPKISPLFTHEVSLTPSCDLERIKIVCMKGQSDC